MNRLREKLELYWRVVSQDLPRKYRETYTLLYPHGVLRKAAKRHPHIRDIQVFIETGTFRGKTAVVESRYFREVHTIELNQKLYEENLRKFKANYPNIRSYLGDSAVVLPEILKGLTEKCLIFLDAHWSGDSRVNWDKSTWKGYKTETSFRGREWPPTSDQQCPLLEESEAIRNHCKFGGLIIIDDWAAAGTRNRSFEGEDWSDISLERIFDALSRPRILHHFETTYAGKRRLNVVYDQDPALKCDHDVSRTSTAG